MIILTPCMKYLILSVFFTAIFSCKNQNNNSTIVVSDNENDSIVFAEGRLVCSVMVTSDDSNDIKVFYDFNPHKTELFYKGDKFKMIEHGGLSLGNIILDNSNFSVYQLDTINKIAYTGEYSDLATANSQVKELMPDYYAPTVAETGESDVILGYTCKKLKIVRSGYVRANTDTYIWVTDSIIFPPARYDIETDENAVITPVPMLIGYQNGTVMRMTYAADSMQVTYEITEIQQMPLSDSLFMIPENYEIR